MYITLQMQTNKYYFQNISNKKIRQQALHNLYAYGKIQVFHGLHNAIYWSFVWRKTIEGRFYIRKKFKTFYLKK